MPVTFVAAGSFAGNATVTTQAIAQPTCAIGDILICAIINKSATANAVTPPDGTWTEVIATEVNDCTTAADDHQFSVFWKRATATTGSHTFTKATDDNVLFGGVIVAYRGALLTGSPLDLTAAARTKTAGAADNVTFPAFDPTATEVRVIFIAFYGNDATTFAAAMSADTNPDCTIDVDVESSTGNDCSIAFTSGTNNGDNVASRTWASNATADAGNTGVVFALVADPGNVWHRLIEQPYFQKPRRASYGVKSAGSFLKTFDTDAQNFIDATAITNDYQRSVLNQLVLDLKTVSLYTKPIAMYPFIGGTANTHKYNLIDPRDSDDAFRLSFINNGGSFTHSATGVKASATGGAYANTFINPDPDTNLNNFHMSFYSRDDIAETNSIDMGCGTGSNIIQMIIQRNLDDFYSILYTVITTWVSGTNTDGRGLTMSSRTSSTSHSVYRNGSSIGSNAASEAGGRPTHDFYLFGYNADGSYSGGTARECAFASIGSGMDSSEAALFNTIIEKYQDSLARGVQ